MDDATIIEFSGRDTVSAPLTEVLRKHMPELHQFAVEAELDGFLRQFSAIARRSVRPGVGRSGHHPGRSVLTGNGPVKSKCPKVPSKTGERVPFRSALVPPCIGR